MRYLTQMNFFNQSLLPICDIEKSDVEDDPRILYYSEIEGLSNLYTYQIGLGGSYCHSYCNVTAKEMWRHNGVVVRDGVRGGSDGALYRRQMSSGSDYDKTICSSHTHCRWLQIKRVKKLCNNDTCPKRGEFDYDPTFKYDYVYKCIFHNVNAKRKES